ncbi:MAG: DUF551 domain-containing protein [Schwartzia succinivorans]|nr:DUF551 domain-containing protein [Schwartzia succinivorans]
MEKRENLKPCPFCGVMPHIYWEAWKDISPDAGVWKLEANHKDSCYITHINGTNISGRSSARRLSQLVEWWNHREELCGNSEQLESGHEKGHVADPGKMVGDLISRQAAIDAIYHHLPSVSRTRARTMLHEVPSAQPEQRWIPCSERLPEANGRYLATRGLNACGALWNRTYIINYSDLMGLKSERIWWDGNVGKSDFERFDDVVAWMPLPKAYREDTE